MRLRFHHRRCTAAFTLVEMILVLTILTVAVGLSAPSLSKFFRGRNLNSEARRFLSLARHGQERAVSEGVPMNLWINASQGQFGLEADASYEDTDPRKIEFTLDENIRLETVVTNVVTKTRTAVASKTPSAAAVKQSQSRNAAYPTIRFLPDGTIADTSPDAVRLIEDGGFAIAVAQSRNRLGYELVKDNQ